MALRVKRVVFLVRLKSWVWGSLPPFQKFEQKVFVQFLSPIEVHHLLERAQKSGPGELLWGWGFGWERGPVLGHKKLGLCALPLEEATT